METVLIEEQIWESLTLINLLWEIKVSDTLWILMQENSKCMIPSTEYGKPFENLEIVKYSPIRLLAEL